MPRIHGSAVGAPVKARPVAAVEPLAPEVSEVPDVSRAVAPVDVSVGDPPEVVLVFAAAAVPGDVVDVVVVVVGGAVVNATTTAHPEMESVVSVAV